MSNTFLSAVWNDYPGDGGSELLVLVALADRANESGVCWPAIETLAAQVRLSRSQTQRVIHRLIDAGLIEVVGNHGGGRRGRHGTGMTRRYRIAVERFTESDLKGRTGTLQGSHGCAMKGRADATQTQREPKDNPQENICADGARVCESLPAWLDQDLWESYVRHYHDLQDMRGKAVPDAWQAKALRILSGLLADGYDPDEVIEQAINSRDGLLLPVSHPKPKGTTPMCTTKFPTMRAAGWRFVGQPVNHPRPTVSIFH